VSYCYQPQNHTESTISFVFLQPALRAWNRSTGQTGLECFVIGSLRAGSLSEREPARIPMMFTCMRQACVQYLDAEL
jgi:hypothetical protein